MIEKDFLQELKNLVGFKIRLYLQNSNVVEGVLLDVKSDFLILDNDGKPFLIFIDKINALTKSAKDFKPVTENKTNVNINHLMELLKELRYHWVTINILNKHTFSGLISKVTNDYVLLINQDELQYIHRSFLSNIYHQDLFTLEFQKKITNHQNEISYKKYNYGTEKTEALFRNNHESKTILSNQQELKNDSEILQDDFGDQQNYLESEEKLHFEEITHINEHHVSEEKYTPTSHLQNELQNEPLDVHLDKENIEQFPTNEKSEFQLNLHELHTLTPTHFEETLQIENQNTEEEKEWLSENLLEEEKENNIHHEQFIIPHKTTVEKKNQMEQSFELENNSYPEEVIRPMKKEDQKKFLVNQYFSVMKHAEKMHHQLSTHNESSALGLNQLLQKQYYALMKHAEKMYLSLKENANVQ